MSNFGAHPIIYPGNTPSERYDWLISGLTRKERHEMQARRELRQQASLNTLLVGFVGDTEGEQAA